MKKLPKNRLFKYAIYLNGVLFIFSTLPSPHDEAFFEILAGFAVGHILFSIWLIDTKWYYCIQIGLVILTLTFYLSFAFNGLLYSFDTNNMRTKYNPLVTALAPKNSYGNSEEEKALTWIFSYIFFNCSLFIRIIDTTYQNS